MRKVSLIIMTAIFAALFCEYAAAQTVAQTSVNGITITDIRLTLAGDRIDASFRADADKRAARGDYSLTLTPVLTDGTNRAALEPVMVQGRRARIQAQRSGVQNDAKITLRNGGSAQYTSSIIYQPWMEGSALSLENTIAWCCSERTGEPVMLAQNLAIAPPAPIAEAKPEPMPEPEPQPTTAERLAVTNGFLAPIAELGDNFRTNPDRYIEEHRDESLTVYFRQAIKLADRSYRNNGAILDRLLAAVREIQDSHDSRITRVVIAGFASPEGNAKSNERLAHDRAMTIKGYILEHTNLSSNMIDIHNGGVDWRGLRDLVAESDMRYKNRILDIIDNMPVWDARLNVGRHGELMRLGGGEPYRYMYREFFPELRNATYIRVYFENKVN